MADGRIGGRRAGIGGRWSGIAARALAPIVVLLALAGCVADPVVPPAPPVATDSLRGVLVVNEGIWFQDNSTLTYYDPSTGAVVQDFFARQNPGLRLGDTGNDIVVHGGRAYVVVSQSHTVEVLELPSGRSLGRVRIGRGEPRKLVVVDDSTAYVSLLKSDEVLRFDPRTLVPGATTAVGPAPEGVAAAAGRVFVANSGWGVFRHGEPKANTLSVLDARTGRETSTIATGSNPVAVRADLGRSLVFVLWGMGHADSAGGVIAYDARTLAEVRRWEVTGAGVAGELALDTSRGRLYLVDGTGDLVRIDVASGAPAMRFVAGGPPSRLGYYGLGVSPVDGAIYASALTSYTLPGVVVVVEPDGRVRGRFDAGLNPSSFAFF